MPDPYSSPEQWYRDLDHERVSTRIHNMRVLLRMSPEELAAVTERDEELPAEGEEESQRRLVRAMNGTRGL